MKERHSPGTPVAFAGGQVPGKVFDHHHPPQDELIHE
jgi:hypothetical protein